MTDSPIDVEFFTDPFSHECWANQPLLRRLRFEFDALAWVPRMTVFLPDTSAPSPSVDVDDHDALDHVWERAGRETGMPVADEIWAHRPPSSSRPACEAVAAARVLFPERCETFLRRVRERAFVDGVPPTTDDELLDLATGVAGVDETALERALADGTGAEAVDADLDRAREVAERVETSTEADGIPALPLRTRRSTDESEDAVIVGPPALRFQRDETATVAGGRLDYATLADVIRRLDPDAGRTTPASKKLGTDVMSGYGVPRELAEQLSSEDFTATVRRYLERFERGFFAEIVTGTRTTPTTCRNALAALERRGVVQERRPDEWELVAGKLT